MQCNNLLNLQLLDSIITLVIGSSLALEQMQNCEWMHHQPLRYRNRYGYMVMQNVPPNSSGGSAIVSLCIGYGCDEIMVEGILLVRFCYGI